MNKDIIQQFLIESVLVTFFGGLIAIIFSLLLSWGINSLQISYGDNMTFQVAVTAQVAIIAFTLTFVVGILSGILPARKAANLKPIEALRFE
ncbi:FtsX-like permease family protein [bacterium]|nr:FtsX-like permease family protein [bacterium]